LRPVLAAKMVAFVGGDPKTFEVPSYELLTPVCTAVV